VWQVPKTASGYEWAECKTWGGGRKVRSLVGAEGAEFDTYYPLRGQVALYRVLAETEPTEEGILGFGSRYGRLGGSASLLGHVLGRTGRADWEVISFEPFPEWRSRILHLREVLHLWDLVRSGDRKGLAEVIRWERPGDVRYRSVPGVYAPLGVAIPGIDEDGVEGQDIFRWYEHRLSLSYTSPVREAEELFRQIPVGDLERPALLFILGYVNGFLTADVGLRLVWDSSTNRAVLQEIPKSLIGAIFLQFSQAIHSDRECRRCQACGRWFELAPGVNRSDRLTCSDSCRSRAYRDRQDRARQLAAAGKSFREIAKELGSTVAKVKKWVTGSKG
jgi:hypothetical protein